MRGTIIKVPDAEPGLLFVDGAQRPFVVEEMWRSPVAPSLNQVVDIETDSAGRISALRVISQDSPAPTTPVMQPRAMAVVSPEPDWEEEQARKALGLSAPPRVPEGPAETDWEDEQVRAAQRQATASAAHKDLRAAWRPSWLPRAFGAVALVIGAAMILFHFGYWTEVRKAQVQMLLQRNQILENEFGASFLALSDVFLGAANTLFLATGVLGVLLVVLAWALWFRRWWMRPALLGWSVLVVVVFAMDYVLVEQVYTAIVATESRATEMFLYQVLQWTRLPPALEDMLVQRIRPHLENALFADANADMAHNIATAVRDYCLVMAVFPASLAVVFGRPAAGRYFRARPTQSGDRGG